MQKRDNEHTAQLLAEGDSLWDAGKQDEAAMKYREAWLKHKDTLTNDMRSAKEVISPYLPKFYTRLIEYELGKGNKAEAERLYRQADKDNIALSLNAEVERKLHPPPAVVGNADEADQGGRKNAQSDLTPKDMTGNSSVKLNKGYFTDSWDYKNGCQVIFEKSVTQSEARKLGDYFERRGDFDNDPVTFQISKPGKTYEFRVVIKTGLEQDPETLEAMRELGLEISQAVFGGARVDVHLCDARMKTLRVIIP